MTCGSGPPPHNCPPAPSNQVTSRHDDINHVAGLSIVVKVIADERHIDGMPAVKQYPTRKVSFDPRASAVADVPAAQNSQRGSLKWQQIDPAHEDAEVARTGSRMNRERVVPAGALVDLISRDAPDHADIRI